ncbi:F/Y rich C-terminus-domain-containing protein, partial [Umbelopsis sp. PMI_123]
NIKNEKIIQIPLKRCLLAVCSSCPDMLSGPNDDCAVYTASFEESDLSTKYNNSVTSNRSSPADKTIWEGHGLMSWILDDASSNELYATGKLGAPTGSYEYTVEVVLQLQPVCRSIPPYQPPPTHHHDSPWLRISDSQPYANSAKPNDGPAYESRHPMQASVPPRSPSSASATSDRSSPTDFQQQQQQQQRHMENNNNNHHMKHPRLIRASTNASATESNSYPYRLPLGKTIHHTRRKKRDTKPPNANELRTIVELEKDDHGNYKLPVEVDSWTVISLGKVIWDKPAFHNQRYIYPVGYVVKNMIDPHRDTQYICSILDGGNEPLFRLQADDNPKEVFQGQTPTSVWTIAVRRAFAVRNMEYGHNPVGPDFFGLRKNTIAKMIQDLPNADKCRNYVWQMFEIGRSKQGRGTKRPQATLADDVIHQHQFEQSVARGPIGRIRSVKLNSSSGTNDSNPALYPMRSDSDIQHNDDDVEEDEMDADE